MKSLERITLGHLKSVLPKTLDPLQFAYCADIRSTDDAVSYVLHRVLKHLDTSSSYARLLFIDLSSAFNTILPSKLYLKLVGLGIDISLCRWVYDFLTNRSQVVRVNSLTSDSITTNTGAPLGCAITIAIFIVHA